jgi:HD-GYP domain-containing protein (c-di-GMP phosphodiesterase class II)
MVRAYDLVKGKKTSPPDVAPEEESSKQAAAEKTAIEEAAQAEARESLRFRDIDILGMGKIMSPTDVEPKDESSKRAAAEQRAAEQKAAEQRAIKDTIITETPPVSAAIETVTPELLIMTAPQRLSERQDDKPVAEVTEGPGEEDRIRMIYVAAKQYMAHVRDQVRKGASFQLEPALIYINNVIKSSHDMASQIYQLTVDYEQEADYYLSSPINILVYGVKIAQRMGYKESKLIEFGLAALLHDIGMFRIPDQILNKAGRLSNSEMDLIKGHPEVAVEIMAPFAATYPKMIRAIYEHQERANGQGYPRGLKGDEICDYAQIIGICDYYEAMTHHRPHKKPLLQADSIKELISSKSNLFEPRITKLFLDEISLYPIGSYVRLNNRNIGRVVATNKTNPMKPVVHLIFDEKGIKLDPPRTIDLRNHPVLNIEGSISIEDLPAS